MRTHFFRYLHLLVPLLGLALGRPPEALAADACMRIDMQACSAGQAALDSPQCGRVLEGVYACGRYEDILYILGDARIALKPQSQYFMGASLFALYSRSQSAALKCEFGTRAKGALESYLVDVQTLGRKTGLYGTAAELRYIYSATKMFNSLKEMKGCLEPLHSTESLGRFVEGFAFTRLKNVLFGIKGGDVLDSVGADFWSSFTALVKQLVQGASEVESGIGMKATEAETSEYYYGKTKGLLQGLVNVTENNDTLTVTFDPLDAIYASVKGTIETPLTGPSGMVTKVTAAIGKVDGPTFDAARARLIEKAKDTERKLAWNSSLLLEDFNKDNSVVKQISSVSASTTAVLRSVQNRYAQVRGCGAEPKPWYCRK